MSEKQENFEQNERIEHGGDAAPLPGAETLVAQESSEKIPGLYIEINGHSIPAEDFWKGNLPEGVFKSSSPGEEISSEEKKETEEIYQDAAFLSDVAASETGRETAAGKAARIAALSTIFETVEDPEEDEIKEQMLEAGAIVAQGGKGGSFWERHQGLRRTIVGLSVAAGVAGILGKSNDAEAGGLERLVNNRNIDRVLNKGDEALRWETRIKQMEARIAQIQGRQEMNNMQIQNLAQGGGAVQNMIMQREMAAARFADIPNPTQAQKIQYENQIRRLDAQMAQTGTRNSMQIRNLENQNRQLSLQITQQRLAITQARLYQTRGVLR